MWGFWSLRNISRDTDLSLVFSITLLDPVIQSPPSAQNEQAPTWKGFKLTTNFYPGVLMTIIINNNQLNRWFIVPIAQRGCLSMFAISSKMDLILHNLEERSERKDKMKCSSFQPQYLVNLIIDFLQLATELRLIQRIVPDHFDDWSLSTQEPHWRIFSQSWMSSFHENPKPFFHWLTPILLSNFNHQYRNALNET